MQKKGMRSVMLFFVFSIILSTTAFAAESRASSRFRSYSATMSAGDDGNLYVLFFVSSENTMEVIGASKIAVQRLNGSRWVTESTLTVADVPEMQTKNAFEHSASIPYEPDDPNAYYRAIVTVYAKDRSGSSTAQVIT